MHKVCYGVEKNLFILYLQNKRLVYLMSSRNELSYTTIPTGDLI